VKKREALSQALNLGWTMLFSLLLPLLAGIWLDNRLGTAPLFILIGTTLGILAATVGVARIAIRTFAEVGSHEQEKTTGANDEEEPE
jgi:F0F1-type ATP synthase assembly protein I